MDKTNEKSEKLEESNAGKKWLASEEDRLIKEYEGEGLDIIEIAKLHKRNPAGIAGRLEKLGKVSNYEETRGYKEWLASSEYKEYKKSKKDKKTEKDPVMDRLSAIEARITGIELDIRIIKTVLIGQNK